MRLANNQFIDNVDGETVFFHNNDVVDLNNNVFRNNAGCRCCDGAYIQRERKRCLSLNTIIPVTEPTGSPVAPTKSDWEYQAPRGGIGYFNYNKRDTTYGPNNWGRVRENAEHLRYKELSETLQRSLVNKCDTDAKQSPIDLCDNLINSDCKEYVKLLPESEDGLLCCFLFHLFLYMLTLW